MKTKAQLGDLDLEVLNPVETKKVLGGAWYDYDGYIPTVEIPWDGNDWGSWWDNSGLIDPNDPWGSGGNDGGGSGGSGSSPDGVLEDPTWAEYWWLANQVPALAIPKMIANKNLALQYGQSLPGAVNGLGDALRHALWSALDAADIGKDKAVEFHTLHETEHPGPDNAMDLHNNNWGFNWFSQNGNPENNMQQFLNDFNNAVNNGQIKTHP